MAAAVILDFGKCQ